jgi:hypothetical protein
VLVEGNVFRGRTREALSTYGLVIPEDSPNSGPEGDFEIDGFANLGAGKLVALVGGWWCVLIWLQRMILGRRRLILRKLGILRRRLIGISSRR